MLAVFLKLDNKSTDNGKLLSIGLVAGTSQGVIDACRHSRFQVMGMIKGFFGVGKFGKYLLGIQNNLKIRGSAHITRPHSPAIKVQPNLFSFLEIFKGHKFGMGCWIYHELVNLSFFIEILHGAPWFRAPRSLQFFSEHSFEWLHRINHIGYKLGF